MEHSDCDNGQLRFSNGSSTMQGRVELCYNHVWFGICADNNYYDYYFAGQFVTQWVMHRVSNFFCIDKQS